jgi:hypothetical protein
MIVSFLFLLDLNIKIILFISINQVITKENKFLCENHIVEAFDIILKEIELQVNENMDCNNKDKIQSLFNKFEEMERDLEVIKNSNELIRLKYQGQVARMDDSLDKKDSDRAIERQIKWQFGESKKLLTLISQIQERKRKVVEKLKEIGIKIC